MPGSGGDEPSKTLAEKLDYLFKTIHPSHRGEYSYREVAAAIEAQGGPTVSASYVHQLRTGGKDNPTKKHLEALAKFFGVSPAYFFDDAETDKIEAQLALLVAMRDANVRNIALRASGLSVEGLDMIRMLIERTHRLESRRGPTAEPSGDSDATSAD